MTKTTAEPAGKSLSKPLKLPRSKTTALLKHWSAAAPLFGVNLGRSSRPSRAEKLPAKTTGVTNPSRLEAEFALQLRAFGVTPSMQEYRPLPTRMYRCDFVWPDQKVAVEIEGGIWMGKGAHSGGTAILRDIEKSNELQLAGWTLIRIADKHLKNGQAISWTKRALGLI